MVGEAVNARDASARIPTVGLHLPHFGPLAQVDVLDEAILAAEDGGLSTVWAGDHVALPAAVASRYPYHESGSASFDHDAPYFDAVSLLTHAAARTRRIRVGLSVLVLPYRHPLMTAKVLASVDQLSRGRLDIGVGVGWMREEFELLGVDFTRRGKLTDAALEVLLDAFADSPTSRADTDYPFPPVGTRPLPVQRPHPPVIIGGHSVPAMRRALRFGDGWQATAGTADELGELVGRLRELAGGQLPKHFEIGSRVHLPRFDATTTPDARILGLLRGYVAAGANHVLVDLWDRDASRYLERLNALLGWLDLEDGKAAALEPGHEDDRDG